MFRRAAASQLNNLVKLQRGCFPALVAPAVPLHHRYYCSPDNTTKGSPLDDVTENTGSPLLNKVPPAAGVESAVPGTTGLGGSVEASPDTHPDFQPKSNTSSIAKEEQDAIKTDIEDTIKEEDVVLFMKGLPEAPICNFSRVIVDILDELGLEYTSFDVLAHPVVRSHVKDVSGWPTIPQLFIKGQFYGGCDVVQDMADSGDLQLLLEKHGIEHRPGKIPRRM